MLNEDRKAMKIQDSENCIDTKYNFWGVFAKMQIKLSCSALRDIVWSTCDILFVFWRKGITLHILRVAKLPCFD